MFVPLSTCVHKTLTFFGVHIPNHLYLQIFMMQKEVCLACYLVLTHTNPQVSQDAKLTVEGEVDQVIALLGRDMLIVIDMSRYGAVNT